MPTSFMRYRARLSRVILGVGISLLVACASESPTETVVTPPPKPVDPVPPPAPNPTANGVLVVSVSGLDANQAADVVVFGPSGYSRVLTASASLTTLAAGRYTVLARTVSASGRNYVPAASTQDVEIGTEGVPVPVTVVYARDAGVLLLGISGLPTSTPAAVVLTSPLGTSTPIGASTVIDGAAPGRWTLTASEVSSGGSRYRPDVNTAEVSVYAGDTSRLATNYRIATGSIALAVLGLPVGVGGSISVVGPNGYARMVDGTETLTSLEPGEYSLTIASALAAGISYVPERVSFSLTVTPSIVAVAANIRYVAQAGRLSISTVGLPAGVTPTFSVTNLGGTLAIAGDGTTGLLSAGTYSFVANTIDQSATSYSPSVPSRQIVVGVGDTVAISVSYNASGTPGSLTIAINGLPAGTSADVQLSGPGGFERLVTSSATIQSLAPGRYHLTVRRVQTASGTLGATPAQRDVDVVAGEASATNVTYGPLPVLIVIPVSGLPLSTTASITLTNPAGATIQVGSTTTLPAVAPGRWRLSAAAISLGGSTYTPSPSSYDVVAESGDTLMMPVVYGVGSGAIAVAITGLPLGSSGSVSVNGPGGYSMSLSGTQTLTALAPGSYTIAASNVTVSGLQFIPSPASRTVTVAASLVAAAAPVVYTAQAGSLAISASGLPGNVTPTFTLTGTAGSRALSGAGTTDSLANGTYTITAATLISGGTTYLPSPSSRSVSVTTGATTSAAFAYTATGTPGSLAVTITGVPGGAAADVAIVGPGGFSQSLTSSASLSSLAPGRYTLTIRNVRVAQGSYGATPNSRDVDVVAGTSTSTSISYAALPSVVEIPVSGLPGGASASATLTSPSSATSSVVGTTLVSPAAVGRWRLAALPISSGGSTYSPSTSNYDQTVLAGDTLRFPLVYSLSTGSIAVAVSGLPSGASGNVTVTGPGSFSQAVTSTATLTNLTPGSYTIAASAISHSGVSYTATPTTRTVAVTASLSAVPAPVVYAAQIGRLTVTASGLPGGAVPTFTLTGTSGSRALSGTGTTDSLPPGSYTLAAASVTSGGSTYTPSPTSASITISAGNTSTSSFTYTTSSPPPSGTNLSIENVYVTQAVQNWAGTAKVVVNRDALVRVFVKASASNTMQPDVRVRVYDGTTLLQTSTIAATVGSVPTAISEGSMSSSWNVLIPAANMRADLRILADLDPTNALGEANRSDNVWPTNGTPKVVPTTTAPLLTIKFVPVTLGGLTGNVTESNKDQYLQTARRIFPLQAVSSSVRAPFVSNVPELQSGNGNSGWTTLLSEINALRTADGAPSRTHYYGVVKVSYGSGYAGFGYIPGRAAVGWDHMPSGDAIAAHELGHNFSRPHTPCGVSGDASYPYSGGQTGQWGWNVNTNSLVSPTSTDVMGYCGNQWISDWTWTSVIDWRAYALVEVDADTPTDGILVWGRVLDGRVELEPAFRVRARLSKRAMRASHTVALSDAAGRTLLELPIDAERVDHETAHDARQFAVVLPWRPEFERSLARVSIRDSRSPFPAALSSSVAAVEAARDGIQVVAPSLSDPEERISEGSQGESRVSWNSSRFPMVMVRDAGSGEVLSFLRRPGDEYKSGGRAVELVFSDGVRSVVRRKEARR